MPTDSELGLLYGLPRGSRLLADRYEVMEPIGEGACSVVYRCRDERLARDVAVKLGPGPSSAEVLQRRFAREAKMMAELSDPGTVVVLDYGRLRQSGHPYIVMELLRGETLRARMERVGAMPLDLVRDVIGEVLLTLATFHERGALHRDLKPENIFLHRPHDSDEVVKILDFGLARLADGSDQVTGQSERLGTPLYMPPELLDPSRKATHRGDLFAVATIAFEMLAGEPPVVRGENESLWRFMQRALVEPRRRLSEIRPEIPERLDALLARCLDLDPDRRPPHARAVLTELVAATGGSSELRATTKSWRLG